MRHHIVGLPFGLPSLFMSSEIEMPDSDSNVTRDQSTEGLPQRVVPAAERRWPHVKR
jgi:hypothetical protein